MVKKILFVFALLVSFAFCQHKNQSQTATRDAKLPGIELSSGAFEDKGLIPQKYTCDGADISPPLAWTTSGDSIKSFALICDDPDAPMKTWVHWVIFNIPTKRHELPEKIPPKKELADGTRQGRNDFGNIGYGGPCPPRGTHRYYFKIYGLDCQLKLKAGATKKQLLKAMKGHVVAKGQLMGRYRR